MGNIGLEPEISREFLDHEYRDACATIARLRAELDGVRSVERRTRDLLKKERQMRCADGRALERVALERDSYRRVFRELMAILDRDGGQAQTGDVDEDLKRGEQTVVGMFAQIEDLTRSVQNEP